jgi:hypothetical protein
LSPEPASYSFFADGALGSVVIGPHQVLDLDRQAEEHGVALDGQVAVAGQWPTKGFVGRWA